MGGTRGRSKAAIEAAAARQFADRGFAGTSVREIAREAGADPAVVIRHFGSKERLFIRTMQVADTDLFRIEPPVDTLAHRLLDYVLDATDSTRNVYLALIRASGSRDVAAALRRAHEEEFVEPLLRVLEGDDRDVRARLVASMIGGLMYALWVVEDSDLVDAGRTSIEQLYLPALQRLVTL